MPPSREGTEIETSLGKLSFRTTRIGTRLTIAFGILVALLTASTFISLSRFEGLNREVTRIVDNHLSAIEQIQQLQAEASHFERSLRACKSIGGPVRTGRSSRPRPRCSPTRATKSRWALTTPAPRGKRTTAARWWARASPDALRIVARFRGCAWARLQTQATAASRA